MAQIMSKDGQCRVRRPPTSSEVKLCDPMHGPFVKPSRGSAEGLFLGPANAGPCGPVPESRGVVQRLSLSSSPPTSCSWPTHARCRLLAWARAAACVLDDDGCNARPQRLGDGGVLRCVRWALGADLVMARPLGDGHLESHRHRFGSGDRCAPNSRWDRCQGAKARCSRPQRRGRSNPKRASR